jgi:hypothetical protein
MKSANGRWASNSTDAIFDQEIMGCIMICKFREMNKSADFGRPTP